ncbi:MAG TPA: type II toxin-antitoxin system VapC family toxin [Mycobacteriales bacterium]|nr:type II toxin-antitoxin system VapC family toxin [Mycobacteriales bacterium]
MSKGRTALVDTSIYVGQERRRPLLAEPPAATAVSIVTIGELRAGVLSADDARSRSIRLQTLMRALATTPLPVDAPVAVAWAELRAALRELKHRMPVNDSWIAATAIAHGMPVVTQDGDYDDVPGLDVIRI